MSQAHIQSFLEEIHLDPSKLSEKDLVTIEKKILDEIVAYHNLQEEIMNSISRILIGDKWVRKNDSEEEKEKFDKRMKKYVMKEVYDKALRIVNYE
jgi:hypothetical protein